MFMKKIKVIMLALLLAAVSSFAESGTNIYVSVNFESDIVGTNPVCSYSGPGGNSTNFAPTATAHAFVVSNSFINSGKALEFIDNDIVQSVQTSWDAFPIDPSATPSNPPALSSMRFDFQFSPLRTDASTAEFINAAICPTNGNPGGSASRYASIRLEGGGSVAFYNGNNGLANRQTGLASGTVHRVSIFANDTLNSITYTDPNNNAATNVLLGNTFDGWLDGVRLTTGAALNGSGGGLSATSNGLARIGFGSGTSVFGCFYNIDNIMISDVNVAITPKYGLTVGKGSGSGLNTNGTMVTITATSTNGRNFVAWTGDTSVLVSNTASTTFPMPARDIILNATYDKTLLTVTSGTGGGAYTNGQQVGISANAPANSWQKFNRWIGDVSAVANVTSATTTVTVPAADIAVVATYSGFFHDFEDEPNLGGAPSIGFPGLPSMTATNFSHVVTGTTNTAGTGKAVEIFDDSIANGAALEYNITPTTNGFSAASARFSFAWNNIGGVGASSMIASFAGYGDGRSMSSTAGRWQDLRLYDNGTIIVSANTKTITPDGGGVQLVSGESHTMNVFANDYDSQTVSYTVNGSNITLAANSVAYWLDGKMLTFSNGMESTSLDIAEIPAGGGTIGTTSGNLGKYGFGTGSGDLLIDYVIDNFGAEELNTTAALYSLSVVSGNGMGLYTNGQQVTISAQAFTNKNFLMWTGDTQYLTDPNSAVTTVNMPATPITLTANYDRFILTVVNGTGSGSYTQGEVVAIGADAAPAGQKYTQWIGDVATVANVKSASTTITMPSKDSIVTAQYAGLFHDFEDETAGLPPAIGSPLTTTQFAPTNTILVVNSAANTAGTGQAVEMLDNSANALGLEYNFTTAGGISAAKASFAFAWKNLSRDQSNAIAAAFGAYNGARSLGSASARWTEARLLDRGAIDFATTVGSANEDQSTALIKGVANTMTIFANDSDSTSATYTVNGTPYTLGTNSVAYWLNGKLMTFNVGAKYISIDSTDTNGVAVLGASENNFGKFGFASSSTDYGLDYIIDDVRAGEMDTNSVYTLVVNNGGSSGLYTNGQQVAIKANVIPGRTFVGWIGDVGALSGANVANTTVTMPASGVTLTATYNNTVLTVVSGTGGGTYTSGNSVQISANSVAGGVFLAWAGDTSAIASNTASTTVTIPNYDITLTATYGYSLTVNGGSGSTTATNRQQVGITATNAPAGYFFDQWIGDSQSVARVSVNSSIFAPSAIVTMSTNAVTLTSTYRLLGLVQRFENDTLGTAPTNDSPIVSTNVLVVGGITNTAGTGQAVELLDNDQNTSMGLEYNIAGSPGLSAAKASFAFSWKDLGGTSGDYMTVAFGENTGSSSKWLGSASQRWTEARLCNNGTAGFVSSPTTNSVDAISNNNNPLVALKKNTMTIFANDYNSTAVNYMVNGTVYSLPANSVAYWLNGAVVPFGTNSYAPMNLSLTNAAGQTIAASEGNLGKFGFSSTKTNDALDYIVDDIVVSKEPWSESLYALRVIGGDNGGLYTNGQKVAISANSASRSFLTWIGDTQYVANASAADTTVTMPGTNVTLTATYTDVILTVKGNATGSVTNYAGYVASIAATDAREGVALRAWTGDTQCVANVTASNTTVTLPVQDISVTASYNYRVTVVSGSLSPAGGLYTNNAVVTATASSVTGKVFTAWLVGDTNLLVLSSNTVSTTFTMTTNPVSLTAAYADVYYELVVNAGNGDGFYTYGARVWITADVVPGDSFTSWSGDTQVVDSVTASNTWVTMPAQNVNLLANFQPAGANHTLTATVSGGNGTITPASASVLAGNSTNFVITANNYYRISTLTTNGGSAGVTFNNLSTNYNYIWSNVQAAGTVTVTFVEQVTTNVPAPVPYSWLAGYFTTNDYNACALADQDGDGVKTWQEYIAGTLPNNAASVLKAAQTTFRSNLNVITWTAQTNRIYSVYSSTNLAKGFALKQDNLSYATNNATGSYTNTAPDGRLNHYQIRVRMQ